MTLGRVAGICFCIVVTAEPATGQEQQGSVSIVTQRTYAAGDLAPWRRVHTRTESGNREIVVDTVESPDIEGRLAPSHETIAETTRTAPTAARARRAVFGFAPDGRRTLLEVTESLWKTLPNGDTRATHDTAAPDVNGRLGLTSRQIEQTRPALLEGHETHTTVLVPDLDNRLQATERTEYRERPIGPGLVEGETTRLVRDINGQWQPVEVRRSEARIVDSNRREEATTIERPDVHGKLAVEERHVTRTTASIAGGGRDTIEEVEGRSPIAPGEPLRVTGRTVTTVRQIGSGRWRTERQQFERDANGLLRLVATDTEERVGD